MGGIGIEALAVRNGKLFFGFRSPNLDDHAIVLEVPSDQLYRKGRETYRLHRVPLGDGLGIREFAVVKEGLLIIAGNAGDEPTREYPEPRDFHEKRGFFLYLWNPEKKSTRRIASFARKLPGRPEAMMVLSEDDVSLELLVLFDGADGAAPRSYKISKKG